MKKVLSLILVAVMVVSMFAGLQISSSALELAPTGQCGESVYWSFDSSTGTLTISGSGEMYHDHVYAYIEEYDEEYYSPFSDNLSIKKVIIENGVTSISDGLFYACKNLTSITIPNSVTSIGKAALGGCGLTSITIPDSVRTIGVNVFYGCESLKTAGSIGSGCDIEFGWTKSIPDHAFYSADLTSIIFPNTIKSIGDGAFYCCSGLTTITIPTSVTSIGSSAFFGCVGLTNLTIPDSVKSIGDSAFIYCSSLTSVTIPNSVTSIGGGAFYECAGLKSVTIGKSVTSIGGGAFSGCSALLTSITIPNSVTSIGSGAFSKCTGLTTISIPDSVTSIGSRAFENTAYYNNSANWNNNVLYIGNHLIEAKDSFSGDYTVKFGTKTIADYAFYGCTGLTSITIPNSVASIGDYAFCNCRELTSMTIPNSVTSIGESAFYSCDNLKDVYYNGTRAQWNKIDIGEENDCLKSATIHCNETAHVHSYLPVVTTPKANAVGYTQYKCSCGEWKKDAKGNVLKDKFTAQTGKVTGLKCVARTAGAQKFAWNAIKDVGGYQIQLLDASGKEVQNRLKVAKTNVYTYPDLKVPGYAYKVKVRTFIKAADGNYYFGPWSAVLNSPTLPKGTSLKSLARAKKAFTAKWKKGACTGYQLQFGRKSNFKGAKTVTFKNVKTVKYTAKKLATNKYYFVRIRTYKKIAGKNYFSKWSKTYKVKTK